MQRASYKANVHNLICSHLTWAPAERGQSGLEMLEESLGKELKDSRQDPCAKSFPILWKPSFSGRAPLSKWHSPKRKQ